MNVQRQSVGVGLILIALWIGFAAASAAAAPRPAPGAVYQVTTGADSGAGSLRAAITAANANPGRDTITWVVDCLDKPVPIVRPFSPLPAITDPVIIDGRAGPGCPYPMQLDGSNAGAATDGLRLSAGGSTIKNLWIYQFAGAGLRLELNGGNLIEDNWILNNDGAGIAVVGGDGNRLRDNEIERNGGDGVRIEAASNHVIGGSEAGAGNRITDNGRNGVTVKAGTGNAILGNAIYANGWLGIDLGDDYITLNDLDGSDADTGPNNLQNFPVLTMFHNSRVVTGTLDSEPNTTYRLEFFSNTSPDESEFGEGETFLVALSVATDVSGTVTFSVTFASSAANIAATATDPYNNTSEFSNVMGLVVNSTGDASDQVKGDGACDTGATIPDGLAECTLRAALEEANAHAGKDIVAFDIPVAGAPVIRPSSALPVIADPIALNATTQGGSGVARVVVDGKNAGADVDGLRIAAGQSTVTGLAIVGFAGHGIVLAGGGGNTVTRNDIGYSTIAPGISAGNGKDGLHLDRSANNLVDDNLISGNRAYGVVISGTQATSNRLQYNTIGADRNGTLDRGNALGGVYVHQAIGNFVGGATAGQRNLISGNDGPGVMISGTLSIANTVQGNRIGTNRDGTGPLANTGAGIYLAQARDTFIGGAAAGAGNLISGNLSHGVVITGAAATGNKVQGNTIGADSTGQCALDAQGNCPLRNFGHGVSIVNAVNNLIGGAPTAFNAASAADEGNRIAYNDGSGVAVRAGNRNGILGNLIFANRRLGIDLEDDGVTLNDAGDADGGGNNGQNFPIIREVRRNAASGTTTVTGTLSSAANTRFRVEFFSGPFSCDPPGAGQAQTWLAAADNVQTNVSGTVTFTVVFPQLLPADEFISATATDPQDNTSEFSYATFSLRASTPTFLPQTPSAWGHYALLYSVLSENALFSSNALVGCAPDLYVAANGDKSNPLKMENDGGGLLTMNKADFNANDVHHSLWFWLRQNNVHTLDLYVAATGKGFASALLADTLTLTPTAKLRLLVLTDLRELYREFEKTGPGSPAADQNGNRVLDYYDAVERTRQYAAAHEGVVMDVRQDAYPADLDYTVGGGIRRNMGASIDNRLARLAPHDADLANVAIIGDDAVVPFYRYPDPLSGFPKSAETKYLSGTHHSVATVLDTQANNVMSDVPYSTMSDATPNAPEAAWGVGRIFARRPLSLIEMFDDYEKPVVIGAATGSAYLFSIANEKNVTGTVTFDWQANTSSFDGLLKAKGYITQTNIVTDRGKPYARWWLNAEKGQQWVPANVSWAQETAGGNRLTIVNSHSSHLQTTTPVTDTYWVHYLDIGPPSPGFVFVDIGCHAGYATGYDATPAGWNYFTHALARGVLERRITYHASTTYGHTTAGAAIRYHDRLHYEFLKALLDGAATVGEARRQAQMAYYAHHNKAALLLRDVSALYGTALYGLPTQPIRRSLTAISAQNAGQIAEAKDSPFAMHHAPLATQIVSLQVPNFRVTTDAQGHTLFEIPNGGALTAEGDGPQLPLLVRTFVLPAGTTGLSVAQVGSVTSIYPGAVRLAPQYAGDRSHGVSPAPFTGTATYPATPFWTTVFSDTRETRLVISAIPLRYDPLAGRVTLVHRLDFRVEYTAPVSEVQIQVITVNGGAPVAVGQASFPIAATIATSMTRPLILRWRIEDVGGLTLRGGEIAFTTVAGSAAVEWRADSLGWLPGPQVLHVLVEDGSGQVVSAAQQEFVAQGRSLIVTTDKGLYSAGDGHAILRAEARDETGAEVRGLAGQFTQTLDGNPLSLAWQEGASYTATLNLAAVTTGTHTLQVTLPGPVTTLADFGVDRDPPRSVASSPPAVQSPAFNVTLSGADDVSGVSRFRVQYRVGATGAWIAWLERSATWDYETGDASDLSPTFGPTEPVVVTRGTTYYFRVRAVDAAGNWETPHAAPDTATTYQSGRLYLPLVLRR